MPPYLKRSPPISTPHELHEDFPGKADLIHHKKETDAHFRHLADAYHAANRAVHRAETRVDAVSEEEEHRLRRERARLKDEIARLLG
jgi:uncharacterized protein YdcH (DUF465 family)